MAEIKNYTLNFGPQHPAAYDALRRRGRRLVEHAGGRGAPVDEQG